MTNESYHQNPNDVYVNKVSKSNIFRMHGDQAYTPAYEVIVTFLAPDDKYRKGRLMIDDEKDIVDNPANDRYSDIHLGPSDKMHTIRYSVWDEDVARHVSKYVEMSAQQLQTVWVDKVPSTLDLLRDVVEKPLDRNRIDVVERSLGFIDDTDDEPEEGKGDSYER